MERAREIMVISLKNRKETSVKVQKILSAWGCMIKTRIGIHDDVLDKCTDTGIIILELIGDKAQIQELERKINLIKEAKASLIDVAI